MGLVDEDDVGDERAHDRQRQGADVLHRDALGERGAAERAMLAVERVPERGIERGLRADDLDRRFDRARRDRVAGDEAAPADREDQEIEVGGILQHLERDGALPCDHQRIVIGVHEGEPARLGDRLGADLGFRHGLAFEHHFSATCLRRLDLHERRRYRHDDGGRDVEALAMVGDRLGVVAGGHGDDAARAGGRVEGCKLVERAALLERVGDLQVLVFDVDIGAGDRRERRVRQHGRAQDRPGDGAAGRLDISDGHAHPGGLLAGTLAPAAARASCTKTVYSPSADGFEGWQGYP